MYGVYSLFAPRSVESAGYNGYRQPSVHPDRVMEEHDLIYMLEGDWEIWQEDTPYLLQTGDVLILHAGRHHFGRWPCTAGARTLFIHLRRAEGDAFFSEAWAGEGLPPLIACGENPRVRSLFQDVIHTHSGETYMREERESALSQLLLRELYLCAHKPESADGALHAVIRAIGDSSGRFLSAQDMAKLADLPERTLRKRFLAAYGVTPCQYQMQYKLRQVVDTLSEYPDVALADLAESYGFCDAFHLSKAFKRQFGVSPAAYRDSRQQN